MKSKSQAWKVRSKGDSYVNIRRWGDCTQHDETVGVLFDSDGDFSLNVRIADGAVTIFGNRDGLRSFAQPLIDLAEPTVPLGHHVHLSSTYFRAEGLPPV
jgi:hypothetical protein